MKNFWKNIKWYLEIFPSIKNTDELVKHLPKGKLWVLNNYLKSSIVFKNIKKVRLTFSILPLA